MKIMKKALALVLSLVMMLAMGVTVFADGDVTAGNYKITINGNSGHTYEAYQIFDGKLSTDEKTLSDIVWGSGIKGADFLTALKADGSALKDDFANCNTAAQVAEVLKGYENDSDKLIAFSKIAGEHLDKIAAQSQEKTGADKKSTYTISGLDAGYYLVKDKDDSQLSEQAYTRYILRVIKDETFDAKDSVPEIEKKIVSGENKVDANTAAIGTAVNYEITATVPNRTGYTKYFYIVNDTLSKGLTYNNDLVVKVGDTTLIKDTDYTVTATTDATSGKTAIKVVFKDFVNNTKFNTGDEIVLSYSATVNQDAVLTDEGNPNDVTLTYSNNPNVTPKSDTDEPGSGDATGETPKSTTKTYVTGLQLTKVNSAGTKLTGAKFSIKGTANEVTIINKEIFKASENGTYYRLKDGTYTDKAPVTEGDEKNVDKYESTEQKYEKVTVVNKDTVAKDIEAVGWVDANGVLTFEGLATGTYTITELVAPDGYNLLAKPITVVISDKADMTSAKWTVTADGTALSAENNLYQLSVVNKEGSVLPTTGGMGTTIFYVVGAILVLGAAVVLITRRRMSK